MRNVTRIVLIGISTVLGLHAQSTQGLITGRLVNSVTGRPVPGGSVSYTSTTLAATGTLESDKNGYYFLPLLSAGTYNIRAVADNFQSQELQQMELPVAGVVQLDFRLRPLNDVWESGQYRSVFLPGTRTIVTFYGPDVDSSRSGSFEGQQGRRGALDTSASYVINPAQIEDLPLQGRDVYTMLVSLPGVTADSGTGRGLGISVAGARPSSSNYLLDGVENDNYLVTGPLNPVAPEAVQEYRISTNNYSAEYGRTAGFIANAVTRAGSNDFHATGYWYLKNDALNAADFADNLNGIGRRTNKENRVGYQAGGPVVRDRLFLSSAFEQLISHAKQDKQTFFLPTVNFISALNLPSTRLARQLLEKYPAPPLPGPALIGSYVAAPPVDVNRTVALERADWVSRSGRDRVMTRLNVSLLDQPYFNWSPYPDFITPLNQTTIGVAGNWTRTWSPSLTGELKLSFAHDNLQWDRAHPEVPTLVSTDGTTLPGSQLFYSYRNRNRSLEPIYSAVWTRARHVVTAGVGFLFRFNAGHLTAGGDGEYLFGGPLAFAFDQPALLYASIDRLSTTKNVQPGFERSYRYDQSYYFVQDSFRVTPRLTINFGVRLELYGAPVNKGGTKDELITLGSGANFNARLAGAKLTAGSPGSQQLFGADNNAWAPRVGFSWDPFNKSKTLLRGSFGLFYDRLFDNLWQNLRNNSVRLPLFGLTGTTNYLQPVSAVLATKPVPGGTETFPSLTLVDPELRNGYAESFFLGVQHQITDNLSLETNGTGSLGRRLITTDIVNRQFTVTTGTGRPNESMPDVAWRSSQGKSDYFGLGTLVRYRLSNLLLQGAWTWSHSIDNQSDPLTGDFFDLNFTRITSGSGNTVRSAFARQYDSQSDRGNSAFDQRHNVFILWTWQSTATRALLRGWEVAGLAAFRTGSPYSVQSITSAPPLTGGVIQNQRADLVNKAAAIYPDPKPATGGVILLNAAAFVEPPDPGRIGNTGRNAFRGPGLYNADLSLSRTFDAPWLRTLPERRQLTFRVDAFNVLNHANLNNPDNLFGSPTFGYASYGRQGTASGFPAVAPLNETARQIQVLVRLRF